MGKVIISRKVLCQYPADPSIQMMPTLVPKVFNITSNLLFGIPRSKNYSGLYWIPNTGQE